MKDLQEIHRINHVTEAEALEASRPIHADGRPWTDEELAARDDDQLPESICDDGSIAKA